MSADRFVERLFWIAIATMASLMPAQNDTWWHLRAGYEMLQTRSFMLTDVFSHSVYGQPWPNYEWLTQVVFASIHALGGMPLLTAVCAASVVAGLAFVHATLRGDAVTKVLLLAGVVAGVTLTWSLRPQAFTLLCLGLTIWLASRHRWGWLPPLFLVWANLHGAVALGGLVLVGSVLGFLWHERRIPRRLLGASVLSAAATLLTPLGLRYWHEIAISIRRSRINEIAEWTPPAWPPEHLVFWIAAAALPLLAIVRRRRLDSAVSKGYLCSSLLALALALRSMRNISPFLMMAAPAFSVLLVPATIRARDERPDARRSALHAALLGIAVLAAAAWVLNQWRAPVPRLGWKPMTAEAARAIESCRGPLYNRYGDGGPIIYFAPRQPVLIDSRQDPYPVWLVHAQWLVEQAGDYPAFFEYFGFQCAAVPPDATVRRQLEADRWRRTFSDSQWVVLERP